MLKSTRLRGSPRRLHLLGFGRRRGDNAHLRAEAGLASAPVAGSTPALLSETEPGALGGAWLTSPAPRPLLLDSSFPPRPGPVSRGPSLSPSGKRQPAPRPPSSPARGLLACSFFSTCGTSPSKESLLLRERDESLFFTARAQWGWQWATRASRGPRGPRACLWGDTFGCHKAGGVSPHWERPGLLLNTRPSTGPLPRRRICSRSQQCLRCVPATHRSSLHTVGAQRRTKDEELLRSPSAPSLFLKNSHA